MGYRVTPSIFEGRLEGSKGANLDEGMGFLSFIKKKVFINV